MAQKPAKQLLHLVFGGELTNLESVEFKDLDKLDVVGVFPNYASAYAAWKAKAQQTVDNAHMRYFIVHLHRLLDPDSAGRRQPNRAPGGSDEIAQRIAHARWFQAALGVSAAGYLRLVWKTSGFVFDPADVYERLQPELPVIFVFWHGQHYMVPFAKPPYYRAKVLISYHRDGEVNAIAAARLGVEAIRGSGDHSGRFGRKGGVTAFISMLTALNEKWSMALTADIPKVSRVAGIGVVKLAQMSGRPIYPVAVATSRRITLDTWDRTVVNLPFSRGAIVTGAPIHVAADADADALEHARRAVEDGINAATERAYAMVDRRARPRRARPRRRGDHG